MDGAWSVWGLDGECVAAMFKRKKSWNLPIKKDEFMSQYS